MKLWFYHHPGCRKIAGQQKSLPETSQRDILHQPDLCALHYDGTLHSCIMRAESFRAIGIHVAAVILHPVCHACLAYIQGSFQASFLALLARYLCFEKVIPVRRRDPG